jgi:hypothetical protein
MRCAHCNKELGAAARTCPKCRRAPGAPDSRKEPAKRPNPFAGKALTQMRLRSLYNSSLGGASVTLDRDDDSDG